MNFEILTLAENAINKAHTAIRDLCSGREKWRMTIPPNHDKDHDIVISEGLRAGEMLSSVVRAKIKIGYKFYFLAGKDRPLHEGLEMMTDEWIEQGNASHQDILSLRDACKELLEYRVDEQAKRR